MSELVFIFLVGLIIGAVLDNLNTNSRWSKDAIKRGAAHYNVVTGIFEWNDTNTNDVEWITIHPRIDTNK